MRRSWNFLEQQGPNARTAMRVVTDGDDGLRNFSLQNPAEAHTRGCIHIVLRAFSIRAIPDSWAANSRV
jgi:transposase-like protein